MVLSEVAPIAPPIALWAIPVSDLAGVARHALDVARVGIPGWRIVFLTPPGELPRELRAAGAAVLEQPFGPDHGFRESAASLRHATRTLRPRVVHTHLSYADVVAAAVVRGPALVTTEHGIARDDLVYHQSSRKAQVMAAVHTARVRRFDHLLAVSSATADAMREKWRVTRPITVIPNGIDAVQHPDRQPGLKVLSLARLAPEKRLDALVTAFASVRAEHPGATLTLAGQGSLEATLRSQVRDLGLESSVSFPGYVDAAQALAEHDVLAMLSVWENCSYALLDAVAHGLGVVASPVGGNPEILPGECLVDPADPGSVAAAIIRQGLNPAQRPTLVPWPSVSDMTARLAGVYEMARSERR